MADHVEGGGLTFGDLQTLLLTGYAMSQEEDEERICQWVLNGAASFLEASLVAIALVPTDGNGSSTVYGKAEESPLNDTMGAAIARLADVDWPANQKPGRVTLLQDTELSPGMRLQGVNHLIRANVSTIQQEFGALFVEIKEDRNLGPRDEFTLATLANQAAVALENARLRREANERAERQASLNRMIRAITSSLDFEGVFRLLSSEVHLLIPHDRASVAFGGPLEGRLPPSMPSPVRMLFSLQAPSFQSSAQWSVRSSKPGKHASGPIWSRSGHF